MPTDEDPAKSGARASEPPHPGEQRNSSSSDANGAQSSYCYELRGPRALDDAQRAALSEFAILQKNGAAADRAARALDLLGQGVGIVEIGGEIVWMNQGLSRQTPETMRRFADCCVDAIQHWRRARASAATLRASFRTGGSWYEVVMTPLRRAGVSSAEPADGAVALLVDATATRRIQDRLDAIDAAGVELLQFDADAVRAMNAPERLRSLEGRVVSATRSVLGFDHFEYRLTDRRTGQLELVFCSGLVPLGIGERIFARAEGNGISGIVAATGESILCPDVAHEPRYVRGLPGAASTLTVPLRLHDRVVGVLNAESSEPAHFDDEDRLGAELLGRYVALSLNILDMLVAERCETNRTILSNVAKETERPLGDIATDARALLANPSAAAVAEIAQRLIDNAARVDELLRNAATGPQGVLGADAFLREGSADPIFAGRRVLVADDELSIRSTVRAVLEQQGCAVSEFADGASAIRAIRERAAAGTPFDLVVSDVRMPDANGYEVFRAAKDASLATPVILLTGFGYDPNHSIVRSSQEGLHCFLFKPFQVSQLLEEAHKALSERPA
jgi:CheY-like chemotaxis protein/GAF domain-containing protein